MYRLKSFVFVLLIISASCLEAQDTLSSKSFFRLLSSRPDKYDSLYIENHSNELLLRFFGVYKFNGFNFSIKESENHVVFSSPPQINLGVGFNYKWLGINLGINFGLIDPNMEKYGKRRRLDGQFQLYQRKLAIDGIFQYYKGFYTRQNNPIPGGEDIITTMPGLRVMNAGFNVLYNYNHERFSYQAALINTEIQKKSAGSLLLGGNFLWEQLKGDTINMLEHYPFLFNDSINFSKISFVNFGIMAGYAYTFVFAKDFYCNLAVTPGINLEISDMSGSRGKRHVGPLFKFTGRGAFGYNKGRFFTSLIFYIDGNVGSHRYGSMFYYSGNARLNVGMRLNVNKKKQNKDL